MGRQEIQKQHPNLQKGLRRLPPHPKACIVVGGLNKNFQQ